MALLRFGVTMASRWAPVSGGSGKSRGGAGGDHERECKAATPQPGGIDGERLNPSDREQHSAGRADEVEMGERIDAQPSVIARPRVARADRHGRDSEAVDRCNEDICSKAQDDDLQRKIGHAATAAGSCSATLRYRFIVILLWASWSAVSSSLPAA
jgi:hypothetical protein